MAVKIILRHDTATNWTSFDPILTLGEIGVETDTLSIKVGDGTSTWSTLAYASASPATVQSMIDAAVSGVLDFAPSALDTLNELAAAINDDPNFFSTVTTSLGTKQDKVSGVSDTEIGYLDGVTSSIQTQLNSKASTTDLSNHESDTTNIHGIADTSALETKTGAQNKADAAEGNANTYTNTQINALTTSDIEEGSNKYFTNQRALDATALAYDAAGTADQALLDANTYTDTAVSGLVAGAPGLLDTLNELSAAINNDASFASTVATSIGEKVAKSGDTMTGFLTLHDDPTSNNHASTKKYVDDSLYAHSADATNIHGISDTADLAYKNSPTFTGTVTLPTDTSIGSVSAAQIQILDGLRASTAELNILDGANISVEELNILDGVTATASEINILDGVTATTLEINYISGVTSGVQSQLDDKAPKNSPTFTGTVSGITKGMVGLGNVDNTSDANKPISTATQSALDDKASITDLSTHASDTTSVHGIADTSALETQTGAQNKADAAESTAKSYTDTHAADTTNIHGIADTSVLETQTGAQNKADAARSYAVGYTDTSINALTTSDIEEGTNLYFTDERAQDAVGLLVGTGLTYTDSTGEIKVTPDTYDAYGAASAAQAAAEGTAASALASHEADTTNIHGIADTSKLVTTDGSQTLTNKTITSPSGLVKADVGLGNVNNTSDANKPISTATQTALDLKANLADPTFTGTVSGITKSMVGLGNVDNTSDANKPISTATQSALDLKADLAGPTLTGTTHVSDLVISGALTFSGTAQEISTTNLSVTDSLIYLADQQYSADAVDIGIYGAYGNSGTTEGSHPHTGLVRDASDGGKWKLVSGTAEPSSNVVDFTGATYDTLKLGALEADSATIGNVSNTELQYLDGVTGAIQTQLDAKLASSTASSTYAPIASPTFTGTVSGVTKAMVGLGSVDNTSDAGKPVSTATQTALDLKADLAGPTFTGTVVLPSTTSIGNVSATELSYVDGVTSAIQTQLDSKQATVTGGATSIVSSNLTASRALTSDSSGKVAVATTTATELGYVSGVTSAIQTQLNAKAPSASPTFTGTVTAPFTTAGVVTSTSGGVLSSESFPKLNADLFGYASTVTAAGTTTLTNASTEYQLFTGTTTQTVVLPVTSTLQGGWTFHIVNNSTGNLTVNSSGGNLVGTVLPNMTMMVTCIGTALTTAADWEYGYTDFGTLTGTGSNVLATSPTIATPTFTGVTTVSSSGIAFTDATQTKAGVPSISTFVTKTASYTMGTDSGTAERDLIVLVDSTSSATISIPTDATTNFPVGTSFDVIRLNTGALNIAAVTPGTTSVVATPGLNFRARYSSATCLKIAANSWIVYGDLAV